jgi:hypothetical protein
MRARVSLSAQLGGWEAGRRRTQRQMENENDHRAAAAAASQSANDATSSSQICRHPLLTIFPPASSESS